MPLVAKENRFMNETNGEVDQTDEYHKVFFETQERSSGLAKKFNDRLDRIPGLSRFTPRVTFLKCSLYRMFDDKNNKEISVLVEKEIDHSKYRKWNDNKGGNRDADGFNVNGAAAEHGDNDLDAISSLWDKFNIEEGSEESDSDDNSEDDDSNAAIATSRRSGETLHFDDYEVAQAFSHFSYNATKRKFLICDLQGVLTEKSTTVTNHYPRFFEFTDPVIHYKSRTGIKCKFGRTDRGQEGIDDFFKTHKCSDLCRLVEKQFVSNRYL
jgi:hypothetical protein